MSDVSPEFGQAIRQIREERGLSRKAVISLLPADRPMAERTLLRYEDGQTKAPGEFLLDFERAVDVPYGTVTRTAAEICGEEISPYPLPQQVQGFVEDEDGNLKPEHEAWQSALMDSVGSAPGDVLALRLYQAMTGRRLAGILGQSLADRVGRYFDALDHEIPGAGLPAARLARDLIAALDRLIEDDEVLQRHFWTVKNAGEEGEIILALVQLLRRLSKDPSPKVDAWSAVHVKSTLSASTGSIPADGASTVTLTVQLKDDNGADLKENIRTLSFDTPVQGSITGITSNNDGTFTATYTAGSTPGAVTIRARLDGARMNQALTITLN